MDKQQLFDVLFSILYNGMPDINAYSSTLSNNVVYLNKCKHGMGKLPVRVSKVVKCGNEGQGNPVLMLQELYMYY